ncbi:hypothetical protein PV326_006161 [Microctonus aethiopoides]|nr:hypothetical protein PV326_006161 [Microctonus aethiopoides]
MSNIDDIQNVMQDFSPMLDSWWPYIIGLIIGLFSALRNYMAGPMCPNDERIDGKIVVITGGSSGIGREIAIELARRGGHIILAVRNYELGEKVSKIINEIPGASAEIKIIDLSSLKSVQEFANQLEVNEIDVLINNAGIVFHPYEKTDEGFEIHFVTNYLGHFLLTQLLLPKLKAAKQGRIINITAERYSKSVINIDDLNFDEKFRPMEAFGQSKLALIMMARTMRTYLKDTNVTINAVNPGLVRNTRHMRNSLITHTFVLKIIMLPLLWLLTKNPIQGAQTAIYAAVTSALSKQSGKYLSDCEVKSPTENALDDDSAEKLYEKSMILVRPFMQNNFIESEMKTKI